MNSRNSRQNGYYQEEEKSNNKSTKGLIVGLGIAGILGYALYKNWNSTKEIETQIPEPKKNPLKVKIDEEESFQCPELLCPISQEIMSDPYMLECGHTFELDSIQAYFQNRDDCPLCRMKVDKKKLYKNYTVRQIIEKKNNKKA